MSYLQLVRSSLEATRRKSFQKTSDRISSKWGNLSYAILESRCPDLYKAVALAEDKLNKVWVDSREGNASQVDFQRVLTEWESVYVQAVAAMRASIELIGSSK
jgi:hypothetical protein